MFLHAIEMLTNICKTPSRKIKRNIHRRLEIFAASNWSYPCKANLLQEFGIRIVMQFLFGKMKSAYVVSVIYILLILRINQKSVLCFRNP